MYGIDTKLALTICAGVLTAKAVWFICMNILSQIVTMFAMESRPGEGRKP